MLRILIFCISTLHHHRLLAAVCKGEHKPSVIVNGDPLYDGAETTVLPFGVEEVELAKLKEESAELIHLELLILPLPCESRITLLQDLVAFGKALIGFGIFVLVKSRYRIGGDAFLDQSCHNLHLLGNRSKLGGDFAVIGKRSLDKPSVLNQGFSVFNEKAQCLPRIFLDSILGQVWRSAFYFALELMVALPYHTAVPAVGVPHLGAVRLSAITAEYSTGEWTLREISVCGFLPSAQLPLNHIPRSCVNDGRVAVLYVVLRNLALVDIHRFRKIIRGELLLKPGISLVFFVGENALDSTELPVFLTAGSGYSVFGEILCDKACVSVKSNSGLRR